MTSPNPRVVPSTEMRHFYRSISKLSFSTETQNSILIDLLRKNNSNKLVELYTKSYKYIDNCYDNSNEGFTGINRKSNSNNTTANGTTKVTSILENGNRENLVSDNTYNFEFIEREISPLRTTRSNYDTGEPADKSGSGGIDFIGRNLTNNLPILGEIKVDGDQNPFYAMIQLLTYLSELSTKKQVERAKNHLLFGNQTDLNFPVEFYLYVLSSRTKNPSAKYDTMLSNSMKLASKIEKEIPQIKEVVFLHMDRVTSKITTE